MHEKKDHIKYLKKEENFVFQKRADLKRYAGGKKLT
jgi:hypothetical protein